MSLNLNQDAIQRANDNSMFNAGDGRARDAEREYQEGLAAMIPARCPRESFTEEQTAIYERRAAEWKALCEKSFNDVISRRASWVPWTVAGPAGYNSKRESKKMDAELKAAQEWGEKRDHFIQNTQKMILDAVPVEIQVEQYRSGKRSDEISSDDPHALEKLHARVDFLRACHEEGKARNTYFRKHGSMYGYKDWTEEQAASANERIAMSMYKVPCAPFELSNGLANIRRLESRISELEKRQEASAAQNAPAPVEYDGFTLRYDVADNRIRLVFDDKPDAETREILKGYSMKWSPSASAWQRQDTPAARRAVERHIIPALIASGKYAAIQQEEKHPVSLADFAAQYASD